MATIKLDGGELQSLLHAIAECGLLERPDPRTIRKLLRALEQQEPWAADDYRGLIDG